MRCTSARRRGARSPAPGRQSSRALSAGSRPSPAPTPFPSNPACASVPRAGKQTWLPTTGTDCWPDSAAHPVGAQVQHLLLEQVLHLAPGAVELFIKPGRAETRLRLRLLRRGVLEPFGPQTGHHKAWIFTGLHHLRLAADPARATPTLARPILKLDQLADTGPPAQAVPRPGPGQRRPQLLDQNRVLGQPQAVVNLGLALAPGHNLLPAKTAVPTHDDPRLGTTFAEGRHDL